MMNVFTSIDDDYKYLCIFNVGHRIRSGPGAVGVKLPPFRSLCNLVHQTLLYVYIVVCCCRVHNNLFKFGNVIKLFYIPGTYTL